mgnify:CR=1 FL=1
MLLTINIRDILSDEKTSDLIREIENIFKNEGLSFEIEEKSTKESDSWDNLDIDEIAVDSGIEDFAENHDHYLYGTRKKA